MNKKNKLPAVSGQRTRIDGKKLFTKPIIANRAPRINDENPSFSPQTRLLTAIHDRDVTTAVEALEQAGYKNQLTQIFLLGWLTPSPRTGGGDA